MPGEEDILLIAAIGNNNGKVNAIPLMSALPSPDDLIAVLAIASVGFAIACFFVTVGVAMGITLPVSERVTIAANAGQAMAIF